MRRFARYFLLMTLMLVPARFAGAAPSPFLLPFDFSAADPRGAYDPGTGTGATPAETVESLVPDDLACGDVVTLFTSVRVKPGAAANQTLDLTFSFLQQPTGKDGAGFAPNLTSAGIVDAAGHITGAAAAAIVHEAIDTSGPHGALRSAVRVGDLDPVETVFLRLGIRLVCQPGSRPTGVLQAALESVAHQGDELQAGRQVVPLKVEGIRQAPPVGENPPPGGETPPPGGEHPKAKGRITVVEKAKGYRDFFFSLFDLATSAEQRFRLDVDPISATPDRTTFADLQPGRFQVTQRLVTEGYVLTGIGCAGGRNVRIGSDGDFDPGDITATIDLSGGEDVVCTFTNTKQSELPAAPAATSLARSPGTTGTNASASGTAATTSLPGASGDSGGPPAGQAPAGDGSPQRPAVGALTLPPGASGSAADERGGTAPERSGAGSKQGGIAGTRAAAWPMVPVAAGASATVPWIALACFMLVAPAIVLTVAWRRKWAATVAQALSRSHQP